MEIIECTPNEYESIISNIDIETYLTKDFLELNKNKVEKVHYLIGKDTKYRFAFALGEINKEWRAPYSAPFANIINLQNSFSIEKYWEFIQLLLEQAKKNDIKLIDVYLPADCYNPYNNSLVLNAMLGNGFKIKYLDINYSFDLEEISLDTYLNNIQRNARKNLRIALDSNLEFIHCNTKEQKIQAYDVIKENRQSRGFPLRMTCEQLMNTIEIVNHNFFLVTKDEEIISAAVVYNLNKEIAQVIYWGDRPNHSQLKSINFISYKLIEFFKNRNFKLLDIGISTEYGKPNYGLCDFKNSIGCKVSNKYRLTIDL